MLFGIFLPKESRVYQPRRWSTHFFAKSDTSKERHVWNCIAVRDFLWGLKLTAVMVREKHLSVCSQWLLHI